MSWVDEVMNATEELESPRSFWYWSALSAISAVVKDNIWLSRGGAYNLYPNIYVMLLAGSALKKGPPVALAKNIVKAVNNTKVIVGRSSIQGIMNELRIGQTTPGGKIAAKSCGFVVASEFSASIVEDPAAFNLLTDLYDRHWNVGDWKSLLKSETFTLKDPTISMLVATNDPHLKAFVGEKDIFGGFFGRMFVIREEEVHRLNSLVDDIKSPIDYNKLAEYPKQLATLTGQFQSLSGTPQGKLYDEWYNQFYQNVKKAKIEDKTGTIGRFGDSVLKVAMLLSISEKPELVITYKAMEEALKACEKFMEGIRKATMGHAGKAQYAEQKLLIIHELLSRENHMISREQLLRKYWMHFNSDELDVMIRSLDEAGMLKPHNYGGVCMYQMNEKTAKELIEHFKARGE